MWFDGTTFEYDRDGKRLGKQFIAVRQFMLDGQWHTLREIADAVGAPEASVSARLRDMRKPRFGELDVQREYVDGGLHVYRLLIPEPVRQGSLAL